jgi:ParB family transcriptional regulator, chromosome partitioning protein
MANTQKILDIDLLEPNPLQPREKIQKDDIVELSDSIKQYGILEPLVIAQTPAGYQIIAGERRWRAAKLAGITEVPVHIVQTSRKGMLEMAIVENVQRTDLDPLERAQAFSRLKAEFGMDSQDIAKRINKSSSYISNTTRLLGLPDAVKDGLVGGQISEGHARALTQIKDEKLLVECYKIILKEAASVRRAEELARQYQDIDNMNNRRQNQNKDAVARTAFEGKIPLWQEKIQSRLHTTAKLNVTRSKKQTKFVITLRGGLEETEADLNKIIDLVTVPTDTDIE